jgi:hypothetical protein
MPERHSAHGWRTVVGGQLRVGATAFGVFVALIGGPALARADQPSLFTDWSGHGRGLQLAPDGTGTLSMYAGASDGDKWAVTWTGDPNRSATITLASVLRHSGSGSGLHVGDRYAAALENVHGDTVLRFTPSGQPGENLLFCTHDEQMRDPSPCGA